MGLKWRYFVLLFFLKKNLLVATLTFDVGSNFIPLFSALRNSSLSFSININIIMV